MTLRIARIALAAALALPAELPASAHPMGNFAICHYSRISAAADGLSVRYVLDMAEIPTVAELMRPELGNSAHPSEAQRAAYATARSAELRRGLHVTAGGVEKPISYTGGSVQLRPGAAGLPTLRLTTDWHVAAERLGPIARVEYRDDNYGVRTGWREIVIAAAGSAMVRSASVGSVDRSHELTAYPSGGATPDDRSATFEVDFTRTSRVAGPVQATPPTVYTAPPATPKDAFSDAIAARRLTPGVMLLGLGLALLFGAMHALSPGHGKAMVAAYLVGSRGTSRHAVALGLTVTITHTLGVFALGAAALLVSRYVVPERLYGWLNLLSGLVVMGVGIWLLAERVRAARHGSEHGHHHHDHGETYGHDHEHGHSHHHVPEGRVSARALIALGISGGIVPCPSALVVLLSAVALHRIAYGLLLLVAFSLGLAAVLVAFGLAAVHARRWFDRKPAAGMLTRRAPMFSAAAITLVGLALVVRALTGSA